MHGTSIMQRYKFDLFCLIPIQSTEDRRTPKIFRISRNLTVSYQDEIILKSLKNLRKYLNSKQRINKKIIYLHPKKVI